MTDDLRKGIRRFRITGVQQQLVHRAGRYALSALHSRAAEAAEGDDRSARKAAQTILRLRRRQLERLAASGWLPLQKPLDYVYAMNCPPFGVVTDQSQVRPCRRPSLCPFCWCRQHIVDMTQRFQTAIGDSAEFELLEVVTTRDLDRLQRSLSGAFDWIKHRKGSLVEYDLKAAVGATVLCSIEPGVGVWRLCHRVLALMPRQPVDYEYVIAPAVEEPGLTIKRQVRRTQPEALAAAVGRVAMYPPAVLLGQPEDVADILSLSVGRRMIDHYGVLRRRRPRPPESEENSG